MKLVMFWMVAAWVAGAAFMPTPARGKGTIFDDDYVPPSRSAPRAPESQPQPPAISPEKPSPAPPPVPSPSPAIVPNDPTPLTSAPSGISEHHTMPDRAARGRCRKVFERTYAAELKNEAPVARQKLAELLLGEAKKTAEGSAERFVLLTGAIQAAEECLSVDVCFNAVNALTREYDVDELAAKAEAINNMFAGSAAMMLASDDNIKSLMALADELMAGDDFADANQIGMALERSIPGIYGVPLKTQVRSKIHEIGIGRDAREKVTPAMETLKKFPNDPAANLAVGSYFCFSRGQWDKGLPLLEKSSDPALKDLAAADLAHPTETEAVIKLADRWYLAAPKLAAMHRPKALQHAAELYESVKAKLVGEQKIAVEKRLLQLLPSGH